MKQDTIKKCYSLLARLEGKKRDSDIIKKLGKQITMHTSTFVEVTFSQEYILEILDTECKKIVAELQELGVKFE